MIRLAVTSRPLFAPVVHVVAGDGWLIAAAERTERGLAVTVDGLSLVAEAVRRTGAARVLVPHGDHWLEQPCGAVLRGTRLELVPQDAVDVVTDAGPVPRT